GYLQELLRGLGMHWPLWPGVDGRAAAQAVERVRAAMAEGMAPGALGDSILRAAEAHAAAPRIAGVPIVFNVPAAAVGLLLTWTPVLGVRESSWFNAAMVLLKLGIIALFVVVGALYVEPDHWSPFAPSGFRGISSAAAIIFFAYIG